MEHDSLYTSELREILPEDLYTGLLAEGLFSDKLPPVFSSRDFMEYCKKNHPRTLLEPKKAMEYKRQRNNNTSRIFRVPDPFAYENLCRVLSSNWDQLLNHFEKNTHHHPYMVSRIHLRKEKGSDCLFKMNYHPWFMDGPEDDDLRIGAFLIQKEDIHNCFGSMDAKAIQKALADEKDQGWVRELIAAIEPADQNGLPIGPHAYNQIAEIILTRIDGDLIKKGYRFLRHIDDYAAYCKDIEQAQEFERELGDLLGEYGMSLSPSKAQTIRLPAPVDEASWLFAVKNIDPFERNGVLDYKAIQRYFDSIIRANTDQDAAAYNYAFRLLKSRKLTNNARHYLLKLFEQLSFIYPYLIPLFHEFEELFIPVDRKEMQRYLNALVGHFIKEDKEEPVAYALLYSMKYDVPVDKDRLRDIFEKDSAVLKTILLMYARWFHLENLEEDLIAQARKLNQEAFDQNWLFVYESLNSDELAQPWKSLKDKKISFIDQKFLGKD